MKSSYIPRDMDDCFIQLKKILKPNGIKELRNMTENNLIHCHFGIGLWMRNHWGLWEGSRLAKWFNARGIKHPDDMSMAIIKSFWHHLKAKKVKAKKENSD